jgi:methyl-accepting chemotaxis protein
MTTSGNRRKVRNLLVHPSFQLRLALIHIVLVVLMVAVLFAILSTLLYYDLHTSGDLWAQYALSRLMLVALQRMAVVVLLIVAVSVVYHILFSHRLCGPLVNVGHTLDYISKGDLTRRVFLRRNDFLKDEAARINTMLANLNDRVRMLKANQNDLTIAATNLAQGPVEDAIRNVIQRNGMLLDEWKLEENTESLGTSG